MKTDSHIPSICFFLFMQTKTPIRSRRRTDTHTPPVISIL